MPTYNYKCQKCGHKFEAKAGMSDPNPPCPNTVEVPYPPPVNRGSKLESCDGEVVKDFNWGKSPSVQFNGGGWAKDGYSK